MCSLLNIQSGTDDGPCCGEAIQKCTRGSLSDDLLWSVLAGSFPFTNWGNQTWLHTPMADASCPEPVVSHDMTIIYEHVKKFLNVWHALCVNNNPGGIKT